MYGKNPKVDAIASSVLQVIEKVTTDTQKGRENGSLNPFTPSKYTLKGDLEKEPEGKNPEKTPARKSIEPKSPDSGAELQSEVSPPGWSGTVKAMKKHKNITNPFALAWSMKKKGDKPHYKAEETEYVDESVLGALKSGAKKVLAKVGGGSDKDQLQRLRDNMYGKKNEEWNKEDAVKRLIAMHKREKDAEKADKKMMQDRKQKNEEVEGVEEELKGNQEKIDANHNGKIDGQDFRILRAKKKTNEEVEQIEEELKTKTVHVPYVYTDRHGSGFGGYDVHYAKEHEAQAHVDRHGHMDVNGKKGWVEKHEIAKHPVHGNWVDANMLRRQPVHEDVESVEEGWDDMVKAAKDSVKTGPKPNGGSGKKQGSAYGGSKQKEKPEHDDVKEGWEGSAKDKAEDKKEAKKRHMSMKDWEKSETDKKHDMKEAKTLSPGQDDAPFEAPTGTTPKDIKDKSGAVHTPMSRARNLARAAMAKIKKDHKLG
jgi:hypothetical protein